MVFAVFAVGIDARRQRGDECGVYLAPDGVGAKAVGHRGDDDRPEPRGKEVVHHVAGGFSPERFRDPDAVGCEFLLAVFAYVVQEDVPEDEAGYALRLEMLHGTGHGSSVVLHIAFRGEVDDVQGDTDTVGLCLQQGGRDAVHGRAVRVSVYGRQQCDDFVFARLHRPQQGMGGVLAAAPVENRLYPFHVTCPALWKNPQTRVRYSGNLPSVPHFRSMPKSSAVVLPMSNPQASSDGRTSSGCRQGFPSGRVQVPSGQWRHVPT